MPLPRRGVLPEVWRVDGVEWCGLRARLAALFSLRRDFGARALGSNRVLQRQGADLAFRDGFPQQGDASPRQPSSQAHAPVTTAGRARRATAARST